MAELFHTFTLGEFLDTLKAGKCVNPSNESDLRCYQQKTSYEWCGVQEDAKPGETTGDCIRRLIQQGWGRGVDLMQQVASEVALPTPQNIRRRSRWADQGDDVEMQRIWAGNIEGAWRKMHKASGLGPQRVRILVDSLASAGVDAEEMRWRGVAAMRLADALITAGYSVQVESVFEGHRDDKYRLRVIVKDYTAPLDLSSLAATTACPAFFRQLGHEWQFVPTKHRTSAGYYVINAEADRFADADDEEAPIFLAGQSIKNAKQATRWVTECVNNLQPQEEELLAA